MGRGAPLRLTVSAPAPEARDGLPPPRVVDAARHLLAGSGGRARLLAHQRLKRFVHRLSFDVLARPASVVVKRLSPGVARVTELVAERWLPAGGLHGACPELLGVVHEPPEAVVWHIYEDVAGSALDGGCLDPERVLPVVELIGDLHSRFARHPLLDECRDLGADRGMGFFSEEVARAIDFLDSLGSGPLPLSREEAVLRDRLLNRVVRIYGEREERALLLEAWGGPETLLHGDLWPTNAMVVPRGDGFHARLIDWDHAGVGPVSYDLSTFLYRFPPEHRPWILGRYREAAARRGWLLPDDATLNLLFETAEYARYACCLAAAAHAASRGERWAFEELEEIDAWFSGFEPALAPERN
jgi:Phosphotransferase enzyme family